MTSTNNKNGEGAGGTKFWPILLIVVYGLRGRGLSFRDMKRLLTFIWLLSVTLLPRG